MERWCGMSAACQPHPRQSCPTSQLACCPGAPPCQVALAPVVISSVFAWTLALQARLPLLPPPLLLRLCTPRCTALLTASSVCAAPQGKSNELPAKLQRDFVPTLFSGAWPVVGGDAYRVPHQLDHCISQACCLLVPASGRALPNLNPCALHRLPMPRQAGASGCPQPRSTLRSCRCSIRWGSDLA